MAPESSSEGFVHFREVAEVCHEPTAPGRAKGLIAAYPSLIAIYPDDLANARFMQDRAAEIMEAAGAQRVMRAAIREQNFSMHLLGTCRMGDDPRTSVVDRYHRTHDLRNLFLCDGSSLVTSGRGQPTMTIQALAFRAADHIARFARAGDI